MIRDLLGVWLGERIGRLSCRQGCGCLVVVAVIVYVFGLIIWLRSG